MHTIVSLKQFIDPEIPADQFKLDPATQRQVRGGLPGRHGCGLGPGLLAGRAEWEDREPRPVNRRRDLRGHPAPGGDDRGQDHRGDQYRPGRADLQGGPPEHRRDFKAIVPAFIKKCRALTEG